MKIACTAFVLMLVAAYGCTTDNLVVEDDSASAATVVEDVVNEDVVNEDVVNEDVANEGHSDVLLLSDTEVQEVDAKQVDTVSTTDSLDQLRAEEVFTLDEDVSTAGLESDPTSFFSPAFRYTPSNAF